MRKKIIISLVLVIVVFCGVIAAYVFGLIPHKVYYAEDFGIKTIYSTVDYNGNGTDDYTDILLGAKKDAENHPVYDGAYYSGGYPPDDIGVCTDVVWRSFKNAGYSLRDMVDNDIANHIDDYPNVEKRDSNIDFRRVKNLRVFFEKYALSLTTDVNDIEEWQPGDIIIFGDDKHIGIVSDKRNKNGQPYIIHNGGQPKREEDYINNAQVTGHYRFDASKIDPDILVAWSD